MSQRRLEFSAWAEQALKSYALQSPQITFLRHNENFTFHVSDTRQGASYLLRLHFPLNEHFLSRMGAYVFMLPNPSDQEWLRERILRFVKNECRLFLQHESV